MRKRRTLDDVTSAKALSLAYHLPVPSGQAGFTLPDGDDPVQALIRQVGRDYLRLTDAQTVRLAQEALTVGTSTERLKALHEPLARHAGPVALELAFEFSTRFGGLLEAWDGTLGQLNKLLPRVTVSDDGKTRMVGWNPLQAGVRWLTWVEHKLRAELPETARRLVDEKKASGAAAAIAAARSRLLSGVGNDAELHLDGHHAEPKVKVRKHLPGGRKNLIVKRGSARFTPKFLAGTVAFYAGLTGKATLTAEGAHLVATSQPCPTWAPLVGSQGLLLGMRPHHVTLNSFWVARAVRANARAVLSRPKLSERTAREAAMLTLVSEEWVNRNARAHRLDALVGNDGDERLADIIAATEPQESSRFEAPLHRADKARALAAYNRYGAVHGPALAALPVRALLPVQAKRLREREVRARWQGLLERAGLPGEGHKAVAAARLAAHLMGLPKDAPLGLLRQELRGVQAALRGARPASPTGQVGNALFAALQGTTLQPVLREEARIARQVRQAFPGLRFTFPLAAAIGFGRKLDQMGKADKTFIAACRKAGVRVKIAEEALARVQHTPTVSRTGERVRVLSAPGFVRPWQLALEAEAVRAGARADQAGAHAARLERDAYAAQREADTAHGDRDWLAALDRASGLRSQFIQARAVADELCRAARTLEESATSLQLAPALEAMLTAEAATDHLVAILTPDTWASDAYFALDARPKGASFDPECPF